MKTECEVCGAEFECEARPDAVQDIEGHRYQGPPTPLETKCKACAELGFSPLPPSPCCEGVLISSDGEFRCSACDTRFSPRSIRNFEFGRRVGDLIKDCTWAYSSGFGRRVLRIALELGL
jgi:hypothetical protein